MILQQVNAKTLNLTVKLGAYQMETALLVTKDMEMLQLMVKLSMVNVLYTIVQMNLWTKTAKFLCREDNVNNVSKASMK